MGRGTKEAGSRTWDTASGLASKMQGRMIASLSTHTEALSPTAKNQLAQNKLGPFKIFTSLRQTKDKVIPGCLFLDYSFLMI